MAERDSTNLLPTGPNGTHFNFSEPNATFPNMSGFDFEGSMTENAIKMSYVGAGVFVCSFFQVRMYSLLQLCVCCVCVWGGGDNPHDNYCKKKGCSVLLSDVCVCVHACVHACMCVCVR